MKRPKSGLIGASAGFVLFLVVAALHTLNFSAQMGVLLAGVVFGQPIEQQALGTRLFVAGSMTVGVVAIGSFFVVVGSVLGILIGAIASHVKFGRKSDDEPLFVVERNGD